MKKLLLFTLIAILALFAIGCETVPESNSNTAVVTNDNTAIVNENTEIVKKEDDGDGWIWDKDVKREDFDKDKDKYKKKADEEKSTIGSGAEDLWIWTKTRAALASTDDLRDSTINVDVDNSVVTLKGTVGTKAQLDSALKVSKAIEGVKDVKNELKVAKDDSITNMNSSMDDKDKKDEKANTNTEKK